MDRLTINDNIQIPLSEVRFRYSRSGGPGGQNVNRVSTRVELVFDMMHSPFLDNDVKQKLRTALRTKLTSDGVLRIVSQESRSQWKNKGAAVERFIMLLRNALRPRKHRTPSTATRSSVERRLEGKKEKGKKKRERRWKDDEDFR